MLITVDVPLDFIKSVDPDSQTRLESLKKENPLEAKRWIEHCFKELPYTVIITLG